MEKALLQGRSREIDAWRGISILMVITGHLMDWRFRNTFQLTAFHDLHSASIWNVMKNFLLRLAVPLPLLGVSIFFVISGYLITTILLREESRYQSVSITAFYARRAFRILPAFSLYLVFIGILTLFGILNVPSLSFLKAGAFLSDTSLPGGIWWLGHTWSLSVEEQFYLVWPLTFSLLSRGNRARWLAIGYVLFLSTSYFPSLTWMWNDQLIIGQAFPCIITGAFYACSPNAVRKVDELATGNKILAAVGLLLVQPFFASMQFLTLVFRPFVPILIAFVFFGSLRKRSIFSEALSARWLSGIGLISYSLYLWQQPFTGSLSYGGGDILRWTILCIPIAAISYFVIEKPMISVGHRISSRIMANRSAYPPMILTTPTPGNVADTLAPPSDL